MIKILIVATLLVGIASANMMDDPNVLMISLVKDGAELGFFAWQDNETGLWTVGVTDGVSRAWFISDENGTVIVT